MIEKRRCGFSIDINRRGERGCRRYLMLGWQPAVEPQAVQPFIEREVGAFEKSARSNRENHWSTGRMRMLGGASIIPLNPLSSLFINGLVRSTFWAHRPPVGPSKVFENIPRLLRGVLAGQVRRREDTFGHRRGKRRLRGTLIRAGLTA